MGIDRMLSRRELDRLAVVRVVAMAAGPQVKTVYVARTHLMTVLEVVDRSMQSGGPDSLMVFQQPVTAAVVCGTATVYQQPEPGAAGSHDG